MPPDVRLASTRAQVEDSLEAINQYLLSRGMTDGLPVIPPTEDRVRAFVEYAGKNAGDVMGVVAPANGQATVEKIAVNAVMAGCKREYMPVLLAAVQAMAETQFNLNGIQATTNPVGPMLILNGPVRKELNLNCESGLMGPGWQANATIGRAVRLVLLNLGGAAPGAVDKSTQGFPGKYTLCIGELEEENPWEPLHVERGFKREQSTVTVTGVHSTSNIIESSPDPNDTILTIQHAMKDVGCNNYHMGRGEPGLLLCPMHAHLLKRLFPTKNDLRKHLWEKVRVPLDWMSSRKKEQLGFAERVIDGTVPIIRRWQDFLIVVGGGAGGLHSTFLPTFGDTLAVTKPIVR